MQRRLRCAQLIGIGPIADYADAAQVHIGRVLAARASPATVRVVDWV
jgi:hypothetical protein